MLMDVHRWEVATLIVDFVSVLCLCCNVFGIVWYVFVIVFCEGYSD